MSTRTESRGAFCFYSLHDSQFHIVGKAPVLSLTRAVLVDVQAYDDTGVLRSMTAKNGKPCKKCGASEWRKDGKCAPCDRAAGAEWQRANSDKIKERKARQYRSNPEKARERATKWKRANPDKVREIDAQWRRTNSDKDKERKAIWRQENPDKKNAIEHRRKARKTAAGGSYTAAEWQALIRYYGGRCLCCGRSDVALTVDHVIPISKGGTSNIDNIQPLCMRCNQSKAGKEIDYRRINRGVTAQAAANPNGDNQND